MNLVPVLLGHRDFFPKEGIMDYVRNSKNFDAIREDLERADALAIFETSNQKTWIVSTSQRMYCILDDIRKEQPHINWSITKLRIMSQNRIILDIVSKNKSERVGLLDFGQDHRNWLYSKRLFTGRSIERAVEDLIREQMMSQLTLKAVKQHQRSNVMAAYRRRKNSDTWHWCGNCSTFPSSGYETSYSKPTSGELCNECEANEKAGECRTL